MQEAFLFASLGCRSHYGVLVISKLFRSLLALVAMSAIH